VSAAEPSHLEARLRGLRAQGRAGLVPFLTAGYPSPDATPALLDALAAAGAVAIELGVPFSDPLADGPDLERAAQRALERGATLGFVLETARAFRARHDVPLVVMTYANPVLAYGALRFARDAAAAGVSGVIVSDLPPEERPDVFAAFAGAGLDVVPLVAPTSAPERVAALARGARGFVYCVSRTGVTGEGGRFAQELDGLVAAVRGATEVPVGIGFGVSDAERARFVAERAEAVIVGAAFARAIEAAKAGGGGAAGEAVGALARTLAEAIGAARKADAPGAAGTPAPRG
jgi:tryptophan synthase alpha chain